MTDTQAPNWTIAYRKFDEPLFHRVTEFKGTWQEAYDFAGKFAISHPEQDQIFYLPTREAEMTEFVTREDIANVMIDDGSRIPVAEDGAL